MFILFFGALHLLFNLIFNSTNGTLSLFITWTKCVTRYFGIKDLNMKSK